MNMERIIFQKSTKFAEKKELLNKMITKYHPILLLKKYTGRNWYKRLFIKHKNLGLGASWSNKNIIIVNFEKDVSYIWLSICHELAHLMLRNPAWYKSKKINAIIQKNNNYQSKKYHYNFCYAIEQTLAFFLQAACENKAGLRKLEWSQWQDTFNKNEVLNFGKKLWPDWLKYLKNLSKYKKIDDWILEILKKHYQ